MKVSIVELESDIQDAPIENFTLTSNDITIESLKQQISRKLSLKEVDFQLEVKNNDDIFVILEEAKTFKDYNIVSNSTIYIEKTNFDTRKRAQSKSLLHNEIIKKRTIKNIYDDFHHRPLKIIKTSSPRNNSENKRNYSFSHFERMEFKSGLIKLIKNKRLVEFKKAIKYYMIHNNFAIDDSLNIENKWNSLHYSCFYQSYDIAYYLITELKADVNIVTKDGYTPLIISMFKENTEITRLLVAVKNLNINYVNKTFGSALHLASRKNMLKIVSILVNGRADVLVKDVKNRYPSDLTTNEYIKNLLLKVMSINKKDRQIVESQVKLSNSNDSQNVQILMPPRVIGYVEKIGNRLPIYRGRFLELDPLLGVIKRYKDFVDFPEKPNEIIKIGEITSCVAELVNSKEEDKLKEEEEEKKSNSNEDDSSSDSGESDNSSNSLVFSSSVKKKNYYYFSITVRHKELYRVQSIKARRKWIELINESMKYAQQTKGSSENSKNSKEIESNQINNVETFIINCKSGNLKKLISKRGSIHLSNKNLIENLKLKDSSIKNSDISKDNIMSNFAAKKEILFKMGLNPYQLIDEPKERGLTFDSFDIISLVGNGTFGQVFKVKLKKSTDNKIYAMKIINKNSLIKNNHLKYAISECNALKLTNSPFIIKLHYAFQTKDNLYLILDYCPGGDIGYHLTYSLFEESEAKFYISELILAIEHLHNLDIIYRDLKPENILIDNENHIKLADFGLAKEKISAASLAHSFCGSFSYLSPEMVLRKGVGKSADIYGIGVCLYEMLCGSTPFFDEDVHKLMNNIINSKLVLHNYFSDELKDLLEKLLCKDPSSRISISQIKEHKFFADIDWDKILNKKIPPPVDFVSMKIQNEIIRGRNKGVFFEFKDKDYDKRNLAENRVRNFTFIRKGSE